MIVWTQQFREILNAIEEIYDPVAVQQFPSHVFRILGGIVPHDIAMLGAVDNATGRWAGSVSEPVPDGWHDRAAELAPTHPCTVYMRNGGDDPVISVNDLVSERELRDLVHYTDLMRPLSVDYHLLAVLRVPGGVGGCSVYRSVPFSEEERQSLAILQPHIARAYLLAQLHARLRRSKFPKSELAPGMEEMTAREREVLYWISQGKRDKEIAQILGISVRTVHKHVSNFLHKLGLETRTAAAGLWREGVGFDAGTTDELMRELGRKNVSGLFAAALMDHRQV